MTSLSSPPPSPTPQDGGRPARGRPVLSVQGLVKHFPVRSHGVLRRVVGEVHAVCGVSFDLHPGRTLGLVGESGSGKSTTARTVLHLQQPTAGRIRFAGQDLADLDRQRLRRLRRDLQIVFQDPYASLDPRMTVGAVIAEPLRVHGRFGAEGPAQVRELMRLVGLHPAHANRYAHEFSGGQRQRIGIARALALKPRVLVLDEPVSALDVSVRAGVVNLLADLRDRLGLAYLFVAHDLGVVRHLADEIAVMYLGKIVEIGPRESLFAQPTHPYTQALISAIPIPDPTRERNRQRIAVHGEPPSPTAPPSGCRFRTRCPKFAADLTDAERRTCVTREPELLDRAPGHRSACHYAEVVRVL